LKISTSVEPDTYAFLTGPDNTAGNDAAGLEFDLHILAGSDGRVDLGHQPACGDVANQAEFLPVGQDDLAHAQDSDMSLAAASVCRGRADQVAVVIGGIPPCPVEHVHSLVPASFVPPGYPVRSA